MPNAPKSYLHPVLQDSQLSDDYLVGSSFTLELQAEVIDSEHSDQVVITTSIELKNGRLRDLLIDGDAMVVLDFYCIDTFYRQTITTNELVFDTAFNPGVIHGEVQGQAWLLASRDLANLRLEGIHPDYGRTATFNLKGYEPLAISLCESITIGFNTASVDNILMIVPASNLDPNSYSIDVSSNKILVQMGDNAYRARGILDSDSERRFLFMSIYKDALVAAIETLLSERDADELSWARSFRSLLESKGMNLEVEGFDFDQINQWALELVGSKGIERVIATND